MAPVLTTNIDIILFDGVCNFCNRYINYIIAHDKANKFVFAPLQSESAQHLAAFYQVDLEGFNSIVVVHNDKIYTQSKAVIHIVKNICTWWLPLAYLAYIIPPFIRNYLYTAFANKRYALFGQSESCMVPTIQIRRKFLS
jgi:predicted DCC family thiol-disulfide oxidoreductase YuxK